MVITLKQMIARCNELADQFDRLAVKFSDSKSVNEKYATLWEKTIMARNYLWEADIILNPSKNSEL